MGRIIKEILVKAFEQLVLLNPVLATKIIFRKCMGYNLDLKNPKTFNEKIQWLKLNEENERMIECGDKYGVRKYAEQKNLKEILCKMHGVYENEDDINFENFPNKYVLKISNGCGQNLVITSKNEFNELNIKNTLKKWRSEKFGLKTAEPHYLKMKSKIICEEYLEDKEKNELEDYKVYCFNSVPLFIMLCTGRTKKNTKYYFFDFDWKPLNYNKDTDNYIKGADSKIEKPKNLEKMYYYAQRLSENIKFVRVDFYNISGRIILGEMTFTPCGGLDKNLPREIDLMMGELIKL